MKGRQYKKPILFVVIACSMLILISTTFYLNNSINLLDENNQKNGDCNSPEDKLRIIISYNPGTFTLSSNKNNVEDDESFLLSWTNSSGADNYSLYQSQDEIPASLAGASLVKSNLTRLNYTIQELPYDPTYYIAVAYNYSGDTKSNCIEIQIVSVDDDEGDAKAEESLAIGMSWFFMVIIASLIAILLAIGFFVKKRNYYRELHKGKEFEIRPRSSVALSEQINFTSNGTANQKKNGPDNEINTTERLIIRNFDNSELVAHINKEESEMLKNIELTLLSDEIMKRIDKFIWKSDKEKLQFIQEMVSLAPEEREEILDYMFEKAKKEEIQK